MSIDPLNIRALFEQPGPPAYPFRDDLGQLCWLEALTEEGGRLAIKQQTPLGERIVTPTGFQIRSRVHEYGGQCFCIVEDVIYFNNFSDGLLYRQPLHDEAVPQAISLPADSSTAYADLHYSKSLDAIVAIQEVAGASAVESVNRIVTFSLQQSAPITPLVLVEGADFYAAPCVSDQGDQLAWLEWSNPYMPWDATQLYCAEITQNKSEITLGKTSLIAGDERTSVCQPGFLSDGDLVFAMDSDAVRRDQPENYWNLYLSHHGNIRALTKSLAEFGEPHWIFGQQRWVQLGSGSLLAVRTRNEADVLYEISISDKQTCEHTNGMSRLSQLSVASNTVLGIAHYVDRSPEIFRFQFAEGCLPAKDCVPAEGAQTAEQFQCARGLHTLKSQPQWIDRAIVSQPELLCFPTRDGETAYANYYAAKPLRADMPISLLVLVHGGPTSRADTALSPLVQYFCQNGFAILDVNHRGSTGHGRRYRQKLLGEWGDIDANDIADAIEFAFTQKQHDRDRVFVRGGSAGGYAVLRALTRFPELFRGGACYYGIGNLITLAEITHKFEGKYTDRLIGEVYDPDRAQQTDSKFRTRSPIFDIDRIRSPLILFQGLDDKVVPPQVSREMVETLAENGVKHEYIEYAGEGHGFRKAQTRIDALTREIKFYREILGKR